MVFKAHKLILAACSKKFADLFETTPTNGQCVVILEATSSDNMAALLEFMYKGEVHVSQEALNSFLKSAENLQVKGLSTETGRLAAQQAQQHIESTALESPNGRRSMRSISSGISSCGNLSSSVMGGGLVAGSGNNATGSLNVPVSGGIGSGGGGGGGGGGGNNSGGGSGPGGLGIGTGLGLPDRCPSTGGIITGPPGVMGGGNNIVGGPPAGLGNGGAGAAHHLGGSTGNLKQECDSLMLPSSSSTMGTMPSYVPPMYHRPISYEPLRKRALRSPYAEQEIRGSVLRDGSKNPSECPSPISKPPYHRPSSSASSNAPTEADTMHSERASPQSSRYDNHSPNTTVAGNCSAPVNMDRSVKSERNNGSTKEPLNDEEHDDLEESREENCAEDLRVKLENSSYSPPPAPPTANASPTTPTALLETLKNPDGTLPGTLAASVAPADMLNLWNATKLNNKNSGMVNTADGKKLKCIYCDRLYGYETNLRAHIRQRHQGIRVPCPFCSRTFTRNNTVRRHIAREHKQEIGLSAGITIAPASVAAAAAAAANHSQ
ncbi:hypothetical protein GQX74_010447 [Glossina fuscipes]|nr:hypothetical protein GQX74_010447 [Glossina fuscipes]